MALVTLDAWAARLIGFDIGIDAGPIVFASNPQTTPQDGACTHVDIAVWALNGRQKVNRNLIHPIGPYTLSGDCGYDYGIVFGVNQPMAAASGTILTGSEVSRAAHNKITDFRAGGILAEGPSTKAHIDHNRILFLHTKDPNCSTPLGAVSSSPAGCSTTSLPDKIDVRSLGKAMANSTTGNVSPSQVNSAFPAAFGIGAEAGAAVDIDYNNVHSGLNFGAPGNSFLSSGIWLIDADGSSRVFRNVVTNTWSGSVRARDISPRPRRPR